LAFFESTLAVLFGSTYALPLCVTFPPKPNELLHNLQVKNGITVLVTVPSLLEQLTQKILSEKNNNIDFKPLAKLRSVMYGGAHCPDEVCQILVNNGVVLLSTYGTTGQLSNIFRALFKYKAYFLLLLIFDSLHTQESIFFSNQRYVHIKTNVLAVL
jgi:long-subunit acyl-CoA synthetase (AMP-forming)